jgi:hypothetical protein
MILLTAVLKWFHILSMLSKVWSLKFSPNTIRSFCILYILGFFHRDMLCRVGFGLMGLHAISSNTMSWSLFLTFETDQFLFLAMWDFLILHLCKTKKITCVLPANACCTVYVNWPPILHAFPF